MLDDIIRGMNPTDSAAAALLTELPSSLQGAFAFIHSFFLFPAWVFRLIGGGWCGVAFASSAWSVEASIASMYLLPVESSASATMTSSGGSASSSTSSSGAATPSASAASGAGEAHVGVVGSVLAGFLGVVGVLL